MVRPLSFLFILRLSVKTKSRRGLLKLIRKIMQTDATENTPNMFVAFASSLSISEQIGLSSPQSSEVSNWILFATTLSMAVRQPMNKHWYLETNRDVCARCWRAVQATHGDCCTCSTPLVLSLETRRIQKTMKSFKQ